VTVRAIGTFLPRPRYRRRSPQRSPASSTWPIRGRWAATRDLAVRWRDTAEIRTRYGYREFTAQPGHFLLLARLYRQAWADDVAPSVLFRAAHRRLLGEQILLPGHSVLARLVAGVRDRAARRLHTRLLAAPPEMRARLEKLLIVPGGSRRSELDRLRRPPFTPTITGLVKALERLADVRALSPATSTCPGCRRLGWRRWPATPIRLGPPSWPTWAPNAGSRPCWPTPTC